jgi:hypothetical protein
MILSDHAAAWERLPEPERRSIRAILVTRADEIRAEIAREKTRKVSPTRRSRGWETNRRALEDSE